MRISGIGTALPAGVVDQRDAARIHGALVASGAGRERTLAALYRRAGIERRHSVLLGEGGTQSFYPPAESPADRGPGTAARMDRYQRHALELGEAAAAAALADAGLDAAEVTHLLTVSCTGFEAPGIDVGLTRRLGLLPTTRRLHVGFMGCHGLFNALAMAAPILVADPRARVLLCSVELCSLHFSYAWDSEKIVADSLFADGAAALVVASAGGTRPLEVRSHGTSLLPDSLDAMTWGIGDHGFEMTLSPRVPALVRDQAAPWLRAWLQAQGLEPESIQAWAVHPGGPRILSAFERGMRLPRGCLEVSREVLATHGNMSSATIGFILDRVRAQESSRPGVAVGFGPGLTVEAFSFAATDDG